MTTNSMNQPKNLLPNYYIVQQPSFPPQYCAKDLVTLLITPSLTPTSLQQSLTATYALSPYQDLNHDYQTGAHVMHVSASQLPDGVLGMYHPATHSITCASDLPSHQRLFVQAHERTHASGVHDESLTDARAAASVGYHLRAFGATSLPK